LAASAAWTADAISAAIEKAVRRTTRHTPKEEYEPQKHRNLSREGREGREGNSCFFFVSFSPSRDPILDPQQGEEFGRTSCTKDASPAQLDSSRCSE